jgi:hypothetical protein
MDENKENINPSEHIKPSNKIKPQIESFEKI